MTKPILLYWDTLSGHSHRVRLCLSLLGLPHEIRQVPLLEGAHKKPEYLALNPNGQLPAIDDNGTVVFDSNGILAYLATVHDPSGQWLPKDAAGLAEVVKWLSFAAGPVKYAACDARLVTVFNAKKDLANCQAIADSAFPQMERRLTGRDFLLGARPTIADVANYTYIAHAPEGGLSLAPYPAIRAWLARIEALPGFVPMERTPVGLQARA